MADISKLEQQADLTVLDVYNKFKKPFFRFKVIDEANKTFCFWFIPHIHKKIAKMKVKRAYRKGYTICDNRTTYIVVKEGEWK